MSHVTYEQAKINKQEIISDYFENNLGQWVNYFALDVDQAAALIKQKHTDIKSFADAVYKPSYVIDLLPKTMAQLSDLTYSNTAKQVQYVNAKTIITAAEAWSSPATIDTTGLWKVVKFQCNASSVTEVYSKNSGIDVTNYTDNDYLLISLPNYPSVNTSVSFVSITTDTSSAGFDGSQTDTFYLSNSNSNISIVNTDDNVELKIPISSLKNVYKSTNLNAGYITGVKFAIQSSTGTPYFYCAGVRMISSNWRYAPLDINTLENKIVKTVPPNGSLPYTTSTAILHSIKSISAATWSSSQITFTTEANHGFTNGNSIKISGIAPNGYNGTYSITDASGNTFKVSKSVDPGAVTTITGAIAEPAQINVSSSSAFPSSGILLINNKEYIRYTTKSTGVLSGITERGVFNSSVTDHASGASVVLHNFDFPVNSIGSNLSTKWPVVYRGFSDDGNPTDQDPSFSNGSVYTIINLGTSTGQNATSLDPNEFCFYFRNGTRNATQTELNIKTQAQLNALNAISDIVPSYIQGTQGTISQIPGVKADLTFSPPLSGSYQDNPNNLESNDGLTQAVLNTKTQTAIEKITGNNITYLSTKLKWYKSGTDLIFKIEIADELSVLYSYTTTQTGVDFWLTTPLVFKTTVIDDTVECQIFALVNNQLQLVYSTNRIESYFLHGSKGVFGWSTDIKDGQTKIDSIRANKIVYGQYQSSVINSITPVKGAQIFANQTSESQLITEIKSNIWTTSTGAFSSIIDNSNYKNPIKIYTISDSNTSVLQGIETNTFNIQNFENLYIKFDINFASNNNLLAFLYEKTTNTYFELNVPPFTRGEWETIRLTAYNDRLLPSACSLVLAEDGYNNNLSWKIKNISAHQREIDWQARSYSDGPWQFGDRDWVPNYFVNLIPNNQFNNTTNKSDGVMFAKYAPELQIRAEALNQYVEIYNFDVVPNYATLGNIIWND
jgi:hypothetical protein